jgi:glutathione S-transferase
MASLVLFFSPGSCSRVSMVALEEAGVDYTTRRVLLADGEQRGPDFRAVNPKGKVPALLVDSRVLTENVAILTFLARRHPEADLLPTADPWQEAEALSLLGWCASGLHPLVTRLRLPQRFCDLPGSVDRVRELAREEMIGQLSVAEERLSRQPWMLGRAWSIADTYLAWAWGRCPESGIDAARFPHLCRHHDNTMTRPAAQRAIRREATN